MGHPSTIDFRPVRRPSPYRIITDSATTIGNASLPSLIRPMPTMAKPRRRATDLGAWFNVAAVRVTRARFTPKSIITRSVSEGSGCPRLRFGLVCRQCYPLLNHADLGLPGAVHVHSCTGARKTRKNCHFMPLFGRSRAPRIRQGPIAKSFQDQQIGRDDDSAKPPESKVAGGPPKLPLYSTKLYTISSP
jgi:hypothetical protein